MKKLLFIMSMFICGILFTSFGLKNKPVNNPIYEYMDSLRNSLVGKEFYNIGFSDSVKNKFDIKSLNGNVVAINIWAFGCKPCIAEMPELNELVKKYKNDSVKFISILGNGILDLNDSSFKSAYKNIDFKYLTVSTDKPLKDIYNFQFIFPQHIILDKKGFVLDYYFGPNTIKIDSLIQKYK